MNPRDSNNWELCCEDCDHEFGHDTTIGVIEAHFLAFHPEAPTIRLTQVWHGIGPAPRGASDRQHRRREQRRKDKDK